jgi:hypothetical protein
MTSSPSLLVQRDLGGFEFYSRQHLRSFLRISSPYNTCIAYAPYARNAPHCSRSINRDKRQDVPDQLEELYQAPVPSRRAARILEDLSSNVVCGITCWHQNKASEVYREWCDHLWNAYLHANDLDPRLWTERTPQLNRASWEAALEDARQEQQDDSSSEEYDSDEDDNNTYDNDLNSRDTTPDTTTSTFNESPFHLNGPDRSQSSQASRSTIRPESSVNSQQSSRSLFGVYRDPEVPPADLALGRPVSSLQSDIVQDLQLMLAYNRRILGPLDPNIAVSSPGDRTPSSWSHGTSTGTSSSAAVSHPESYLTGSNNTPHEPGLDSSHSSGTNEIPSSTVDTLSTSEETAVEELAISRENDDETSVGEPTEDEDSDTSEDTEETERQHGSEDEEAEGGSQDGNNDVEQPRARASGLEIIDTRDTDSSQDRIEGRSAGGSSPESEATVTERDEYAHGDDVTDLLSLGGSFFDDAEEVIEVVTVPQALVPSRPGFRRYPQASTPLSQLTQLWNTMTQTVSHNRRHSGFIYAFARRSLPDFLKIGYVKAAAIPQPPDSDPVDNRLANWQADCGHPITEVFRVPISCRAVERIESLVHLTLRGSRWVENPPCRRCERRGRSRRGRGGGRHDEWFEVDEQTARHVVTVWASFAAKQPYDQWGRMVDFWSETVDEQRRLMREGDTTMNWVDRMPRLLQELTRRELASISPFSR